jgi:hypothetical protein
MIAGYVNLITADTATIACSVAPQSGNEAINILDNYLLSVYKVLALSGTVTITLGTAKYLPLVTLHNIEFTTSCNVSLYSATDTLVYSETKTSTGISGFDYDSLVFLNGASGNYNGDEIKTFNTTPVKKIIISFVNASASDIFLLGYIFGGDITEFGCAEKIQPTDSSAETVTITESNVASVKNDFKYQAISITTSKNRDFITQFRPAVRNIFDTGYGTARPWVFCPPEMGYLIPETFLGILDSANLKYDLTMLSDNTKCLGQATIGIREVFGNGNK